MKIVILGGTGLIGKKLIRILRSQGHQAISASPSSGVNAVTGAGLAEVLAGAKVVVDVSNSPSFEAAAVLAFFETSTRNLMAAELAAGVQHHIALSVVGADAMRESGYMRAKVVQETQIQNGPIPYTILRATQFFEFIESIAQASTIDGTVRIPDALFQPVAAEDVAVALADLANKPPVNQIVDLAGPEIAPMATFISKYLESRGDSPTVNVDEHASYFGQPLSERTLTPLGAFRKGAINLDQWLQSNSNAIVGAR